MNAIPMRRRALLANGTLVLLVAACATATTTPSLSAQLAADGQLLANGLAAIEPLPASASAVLAQVQAAAATVAKDVAALAASATPSTSVVSEIVGEVGDIAPIVLGLFPGGGTAVAIVQALVSLAPSLLSALGITAAPRAGGVAPSMTPAQARAVLSALPRA
jgi:hypothetical protein